MENTKRPRGAPKKENPATERFHGRCMPEEKKRWGNAAQKSGLSVSAWLKNLANKNA